MENVKQKIENFLEETYNTLKEYTDKKYFSISVNGVTLCNAKRIEIEKKNGQTKGLDKIRITFLDANNTMVALASCYTRDRVSVRRDFDDKFPSLDITIERVL